MPEYFASSVLSLVHGRFRTEPGSLLAVPEPEREGKSKGETAEKGSDGASGRLRRHHRIGSCRP
jgi:hypothetical protein